MDLKKIIITGGAGYIGAKVVEELLASGNYTVTIIDKFLFDPNSLNEFSKHKNLKIVNSDIREIEKFKDELRGTDTLIHLAALVGEKACNISESNTQSINYDATINLIKNCVEQNVKKFIFMSTASSYGVQDISQIANEQTKLNPVSLYARSKIECEKKILDSYSDKIEITVFRPSTVYGDSQRMRFDLILNHLILDAIKKKEIVVFGPKMVRPLMWVGEPARVYKIIIDENSDKFKSQIFNLGYENENYEKIEIANLIQNNYFKNIDIQIIDKDPDLRSYRLSFEKMKKFFNLEPKSNILKEAEVMIKKLKSNSYGDTKAKIFYNA